MVYNKHTVSTTCNSHVLKRNANKTKIGSKIDSKEENWTVEWSQWTSQVNKIVADGIQSKEMCDSTFGGGKQAKRTSGC